MARPQIDFRVNGTFVRRGFWCFLGDDFSYFYVRKVFVVSRLVLPERDKFNAV